MVQVPCYRLHTYNLAMDCRGSPLADPRPRREAIPLWPWEREEIERAEDAVARQAAGEDPGCDGSDHALSDWAWCPFGFVAGCVWGDDGSWKIEHLDLSGAADGILRRAARFGHAEMPSRMTLREAVDMSLWEPDFGRVGIATTRWFDVEGGADRGAPSPDA